MHTLVAKIQPNKVVRWCPDGEILAILRPAFPASHVQHISDMHSKLALRSHHVWKYDIQSATAEIRRGKEERKKRKNNKLQDENINNVRICYAG